MSIPNVEHRPEEYPFRIVNATVEENASTNKHAQRLPCERLRSNALVADYGDNSCIVANSEISAPHRHIMARFRLMLPPHRGNVQVADKAQQQDKK